jgi:hypothetical protein
MMNNDQNGHNDYKDNNEDNYEENYEDMNVNSRFFIDDEEEFDNFCADLDKHAPISEPDAERLAYTLEARLIADCDDDESDSAQMHADAIFRCAAAFPDSDFIRKIQFQAALYLIDSAGRLEEFDFVQKWLNKLRDLLAAGRNRTLLTRVYANGLVLTISNLLDCAAPDMVKAQSIYNDVKKLSGDNPYDPVILAMLAWGQRLFIREAVYIKDYAQAEQLLQNLSKTLAQNPGNALLANEYAKACYGAFLSQITLDDNFDAKMAAEVERICLAYAESYQALSQENSDYEFPGYESRQLYHVFVNTLSETAAFFTKNNDLLSLTDLEKRFSAFPKPAWVEVTVESQLLSNLAGVCGNQRNFPKVIEYLNNLRLLAQKTFDDKDRQTVNHSLTDALYNLATDYINENPVFHETKISALLQDMEAIAAQTDDSHDHCRYAMALYNQTFKLEDAQVPHKPVWDKLFAYALKHDVTNEQADLIASMEAAMAGSEDNPSEAALHCQRTKQIAQHITYQAVQSMPIRRAAALFNLLSVLSRAGQITAAEETYAELSQLAEQYFPKKNIFREIILRLVKGGLNLASDYGEAGNIPAAEKIYASMIRLGQPLNKDPEIANRLVNTAYNLCLDLKKTSLPVRKFIFFKVQDPLVTAKIKNIYEGLKDAGPEGVAAERLKLLKIMARK